MERLRVCAAMVVLAAGAGMIGCAGAPRWGGAPIGAGGNGTGPTVYPQLTEIPGRPDAGKTPEETEAMIRSLVADRAGTAEAGERLNHEIKTEFEIPELPDT